MADWQNGRLAKWQIGKMAEWQIFSLAECEGDAHAAMPRETNEGSEVYGRNYIAVWHTHPNQS